MARSIYASGAYVKCDAALGREASPTAAVIDSQSVKSAEKGGLRLIRRATTHVRRSSARSVHILVDTQGLLMLCNRSYRRYSGSRWRRIRHGDHVRHVSVPDKTLRRWRLSRPVVSPRRGKNIGAANFELIKFRSHKRICRPPEALGGRTNVRMARPVQASRQRLGESQPKGTRISAPRFNPPHAQKTMQSRTIFPEKF